MSSPVRRLHLCLNNLVVQALSVAQPSLWGQTCSMLSVSSQSKDLVKTHARFLCLQVRRARLALLQIRASWRVRCTTRRWRRAPRASDSPSSEVTARTSFCRWKTCSAMALPPTTTRWRPVSKASADVFEDLCVSNSSFLWYYTLIIFQPACNLHLEVFFLTLEHHLTQRFSRRMSWGIRA